MKSNRNTITVPANVAATEYVVKHHPRNQHIQLGLKFGEYNFTTIVYMEIKEFLKKLGVQERDLKES